MANCEIIKSDREYKNNYVEVWSVYWLDNLIHPHFGLNVNYKFLNVNVNNFLAAFRLSRNVDPSQSIY